MPAALPTGRQGRLLAILITLLAGLFLWLGVASPLAALHEERSDRLAERRALARHMELLAEQLPALRQEAAAAAKAGPPPMLVLEGASDAVAGAALQNMVQEMASGAGANLASVENLPSEQAGAYRRIGLKLSLSANWPVLVRLLRSIEEAKPPMLIDDLQIHGSPLPMLPGPLPLEAGFTVFAFRAGDAQTSKQ